MQSISEFMIYNIHLNICELIVRFVAHLCTFFSIQNCASKIIYFLDFVLHVLESIKGINNNQNPTFW